MNEYEIDDFLANIGDDVFLSNDMDVSPLEAPVQDATAMDFNSTPLTVEPVDDASVACAMSRDFVVYGEACANTIIKQALEQRTQSAFVVNHFFPIRPFEDFSVSYGAQKVFDEPNAGGNSVNSEAMSFEVLHRLYGARLVKTEMAIEYWHPNSKKTDYSMELYGRRIGVSVTRAMKYRGVFTPEDARVLLYKKLNGVNVSTVGVVRADRWEKQILHVWTPADYIAITLFREYMTLPADLRSNTVVIVTVSNESPWLYGNVVKEPVV